MTELIEKEDILEAGKRIRNYIHRTPVLSSASINEITGAKIFFKCENLQKAGAFKMRGASNALLLLNEQLRIKGVATHSSGNHAAALALAAKNLGIKAYVVMPSNSSRVKIAAVESYGGMITFCEPTLEARESTLKLLLAKLGATEIHPYNNLNIIAGQATAAKELIEDCPNLDIIIAPVGGGGLLSGTALATHNFSPATIVIGAEPEGAKDAFLSFQQNKIIPSIDPDTIADGLRTSLGSYTFPLIRKHVSEIQLASDQEIIEAMRLIWERMKILIEPSSAVPLAIILKNKDFYAGNNVGIILSGGNVELTKLPF
ncbi:MAG: pyridoxal-phosphate dependent enzyme [Bacteroidales bacterium]|nr:pyridoxal-phosphate dependent enzyme [Bacteroidales bacterium]